MGVGTPVVSDLDAIRKTTFIVLVLLPVVAVGVWGSVSRGGVWTWLVILGIPCLLAGFGALFAFGLLAAVRRQSYAMIVLGIILTPFAFAVWAEILRQRGDRPAMDEQALEEMPEEEPPAGGTTGRADRAARLVPAVGLTERPLPTQTGSAVWPVRVGPDAHETPPPTYAPRISFSPSITCRTSSGDARPNGRPIRSVDRVRTWPILTHDRLGSFVERSSSVSGKLARCG